jgi:hypothetical protein
MVEVRNIYVKKGKVVPVHTLKTYRGSGSIYPLTVNRNTRQKWELSLIFRPIYHWVKSRQYELDRRFGGHQSRCGRLGEEKNLLSLLGFEIRILQPVA